MASSTSRGRPIDGINVTPLVDITLVLLIIFMVTAKIAVAPAVPLDLPKASKSEEVQTILAVAVTPDGALAINGEPCPDEMFHARAKAALQRDDSLRAVIQADGSVPHRRVMEIMDKLKVAGIERIAFGAQRKPHPPGTSNDVDLPDSPRSPAHLH